MSSTIKYKTWIADDHQIVLDGFRLLISLRSDLEIIGESNNGHHLLEGLKNNEVDLVITDLKMPGYSGLELMTLIKKNFPHIKLLVVSMTDELEIIYRLFLAETDGYILKNIGKQELFNAIDDLLDDKLHYQKELYDKIIARQRKEKYIPVKTVLSKREIEILQLIMQEKSSAEIAETIHLSKQTIDTHRKNIYQKTGVNTLVGLIKYALKMDIADL